MFPIPRTQLFLFCFMDNLIGMMSSMIWFMVFQLVRELPAFMEPKGFSPCCESLSLDPVLGQLSPVHTFTDRLFMFFV
jgi:hypothetical protein